MRKKLQLTIIRGDLIKKKKTKSKSKTKNEKLIKNQECKVWKKCLTLYARM